MTSFDVVVLAGGSGRRLGGVDKAALEVGGMALLDRVLTASARAGRTVVVGAERATVRPVTWTREHPAGGGPVAGLAAGLAALGAVDGPVVVLATDLLALTASDLDRLLARAGELERVDAVLFEDADGHLQPLAGLYGSGRLRAVVAELGDVRGASMKQLLTGLRIVTEPDGGATADCDTPEQLAAARTAPRVMSEGGDVCPS